MNISYKCIIQIIQKYIQILSKELYKTLKYQRGQNIRTRLNLAGKPGDEKQFAESSPEQLNVR